MNKVNTHTLSFLVSTRDDIKNHFENSFIPSVAKECEISLKKYDQQTIKELNQIYADLAMIIVLKILNKDDESEE
jgi:hypothetical protein